MTAIAIVDKNRAIAKNGRQVIHIPEDMAFFRAQTLGGVVVMGRKTLQALPGGQPLAGRVNVVLTHGGAGLLPAGCVGATLKGLPGILAEYRDEKIFVAGGGEIYRELLPHCREALLTKVYTDGQGDVFFPNIDEDEAWEIVEKSAVKYHGTIPYQFIRYRNRAPVLF